jgi:hypothetical protein
MKTAPSCEVTILRLPLFPPSTHSIRILGGKIVRMLGYITALHRALGFERWNLSLLLAFASRFIPRL